MPDKFIEEYESYFSFRWERDKNLAISSNQGNRIIDLLPSHIKMQLYRQFFFFNFSQIYAKMFDLSNFAKLRRQVLLKKIFVPKGKPSKMQGVDFLHPTNVDLILEVLKYLEPI